LVFSKHEERITRPALRREAKSRARTRALEGGSNEQTRIDMTIKLMNVKSIKK